MEALKLKTVDDLLLAQQQNERIELINGDLVKRPMARSEHSFVQGSLSDEMLFFKRQRDHSGWWILPEVSVRYSDNHCPVHDLAGWRKERVPQRPTGVSDILPDWVCEITSPGHERKDVFGMLISLQHYQVPYYWVISPEDKSILVYELADGAYRLTFSMHCDAADTCQQLLIPPFTEQGLNFAYVFGYED